MLCSCSYVTLKPIYRYLYTTNQLERLAKEVKRRTKVGETFCSEDAVEKLFYLFLSQLDKAWGARKLRGFAKIRYIMFFFTRFN